MRPIIPLDYQATIRHIIGFRSMNRAFDLSNYSVIPTEAQLNCLKVQGYTRAIIGSSFGNVWQRQLAICALAGLEVHEYQFPTATKSTHNPWWLDCETDDSTMDTVRAICEWRQPPVGIYTRRLWWTEHMNDWQIAAEFPDLQLWDASYGDPPPAFIPYGGFASRSMHQWHDTIETCGISVDLNIIEEDELMSAEYDKLKAALDAMYGSLISLAQHVYAEDDPKLADVQKKLDAVKVALT